MYIENEEFLRGSEESGTQTDISIPSLLYRLVKTTCMYIYTCKASDNYRLVSILIHFIINMSDAYMYMYIVYQPLFLPNATLVQTQTNLH